MSQSIHSVAQHCTRDGARRLAARIAKYWLDQGYEVRTWVEEQGFDATIRGAYGVVRSDMVNGWPAEKVKPAPRQTYTHPMVKA